MRGSSALIGRHASWPEAQTLLRPLVEYGAAAIGAVAVMIALWGVAIGLFQLVQLERSRLTGSDRTRLAERLRHELSFYMLLTLNFLVASDIIETLVVPTFEHLGVLGAVTVIRVVTGITLARELGDVQSREQRSLGADSSARSQQHASRAPVSKPLSVDDIQRAHNSELERTSLWPPSPE